MHGMHKTPVYTLWTNIKQRTTNPKHVSWKYSGAKGVRLCDEWYDFAVFYAYVGDPPFPGASLDRYPDNDGDYKPGNVRWASREDQQRNKGSNRWITFQGRTTVQAQWAKELGITQSNLVHRLENWSKKRALTEPPKKRRSRKTMERKEDPR